MQIIPAAPQFPIIPTRIRRSPAAFSLVETVLALGIVAFAFVGLMGMLPAGLQTFRKAVDTTVGAQIAQRVVGDAQQTDFDVLVPSSITGDFYVLPVRYFDDQGNEIVVPGGGALTADQALRALYHVRVRGSKPDGDFTSLPQVKGARHHPRDSTFLTIQIANNPANKTLTVDTKQLWDVAAANKVGVPIMMQSAVVTRNGTKKKN
jgi:uncharacterized protein (TIGR02598 family)